MNHPDRLIELLTERGERTLSQSESAELSALLAQNDGWDIDDFEYAAAAADMALAPPLEMMPVALKSQILSDALARATDIQHHRTTAVERPGPVVPAAVPTAAPQPVTPPAAPHDPQATATPPSVLPTSQPTKELVAANDNKPTKGIVFMGAILGWTAAAAAAVIAVVGWQDELRPPTPITELRAALVEQDTAVKTAWTQTKDPLGTKVTGDVVWSDARQEGYMRFSGLPRNDPTQHQYQLWIFDKDRDERFPVDGGVFNIDSDTGEVIVDIRAKIPVKEATLFAVTLEKPGGVVVSTRERLVTLAKPKA